MENFKPKRASSIIAKYKNILMSGDIIKYDCGGTDYFVSIPREDNVPRNFKIKENVSNCSDYPHLDACMDELKQVINELKKDGYIVKNVRCEYSGCCQYSAYLLYLE